LETKPQQASARLRQLQEHLKKNVFVGKDDIINLMVICTVAREPLLLVGPPGTAKSDLVVAFCQGLGLRSQNEDDSASTRDYFEYLLTPYTEPNEIFGPVDLKELQEHGHFTRRREGMLQQAHMAFLDEIFKANSAILNALLTLLNERRYYEAGRYYRSPLITLFGATNRVPTSAELDALYDRFTLRIQCENVPDEQQMLMVQRACSLEAQKSKGEEYLKPMAGLQDVRALNQALLDKFKPEALAKLEFLPKFFDKIRAVRLDKVCRINDRKMIKLLKLIFARALLAAREPAREDMMLLQYTWDDPENEYQQEKLEQIAYH